MLPSPIAAMKTHHRSCPLCEAICGLEIVTDGERVVSIRGDREDPLSRGYLCPKAYALKDLHEDPDRLRRPLRRRGNDFEEIGWDEAIAEAGERLGGIRKQHGRHAVATYLGNPSVHNVGASLGGLLLLATLRNRTRFSATSLDQGPKQLAGMWMYGNQALIPVPDVDRTAYLLVLGANPLVSNGSLMTAPDMKGRLRAIRDRGGKVVVIDPRRSETAEVADRHHFIRPGSDAFFLMSLVHVLFAEGRARLGRLGGFTRGVEAVRAASAPFSPERTARLTGIPADATRTIAREISDAGSAVVYGRIGTCTQRFGTASSWLVDTINVLTGNLDRPGGAMFTTPALDLPGLAKRVGMLGHQGLWKSRVRGVAEALGELATAVLAEEITTPGDDRIRALVTVAGNPVLSSPGGDKLRGALGTLECMVSVDPYLNETTRHAHYVLPPLGPLEKDNVDIIFHALAVRNTVRFSPRVFEAPAGGRDDYEILADLSRAIARGMGGLGHRLKTEASAQTMQPLRAVELLLRTGPHGGGARALVGGGLTLAKLRAAEHGIDLGPLEPRLPGVLCTRDASIDLAPAALLGEARRMAEELARADAAPGLVLIGRRELRSNNSWMHNAPSLVKGPSRCLLVMHPDDARTRGLTAGARAQLESRAGLIEVEVALSDEVMPGVVSLPHGYGHDTASAQAGLSVGRVASAVPGGSVNDVTDPMELDALSGTAVLSGVPVELRAIAVAVAVGA
jgi:anaerobic selenocysteine-containing dehydrogenase